MINITFKQENGDAVAVAAETGTSLMEAAVDNGVEGILAECGGACSCATCHVYVDPSFANKLSAKSEDEAFILEGSMHVTDESRLSCQIELSEKLEGLVVSVPASQY